MRRLLAAAMMLVLLLCSACGGSEKTTKAADQFRETLIAQNGCTFSAELTADTENGTFTFSADCRCTADGLCSLTVTAPETISGITAKMHASSTVLEFDGASLDFGRMTDNLSSPLLAPLTLGNAWASGYLDSAGMDGDRYRATYLLGYDQQELQVETWFTEGVPVNAEIYEDGKRLVCVTIKDFVPGGVELSEDGA